MAVPTSGAVAFSTVNSVFGYGQWMTQYQGRLFYYGAGAYGYFPAGGGWGMSYFYGKSNHDEWNCLCDCNCNCGK
jgi:hypothetical protein